MPWECRARPLILFGQHCTVSCFRVCWSGCFSNWGDTVISNTKCHMNQAELVFEEINCTGYTASEEAYPITATDVTILFTDIGSKPLCPFISFWKPVFLVFSSLIFLFVPTMCVNLHCVLRRLLRVQTEGGGYADGTLCHKPTVSPGIWEKASKHVRL